MGMGMGMDTGIVTITDMIMGIVMNMGTAMTVMTASP